jgi:hypothetical protein
MSNIDQKDDPYVAGDGVVEQKSEDEVSNPA